MEYHIVNAIEFAHFLVQYVQHHFAVMNSGHFQVQVRVILYVRVGELLLPCCMQNQIRHLPVYKCN